MEQVTEKKENLVNEESSLTLFEKLLEKHSEENFSKKTQPQTGTTTTSTEAEDSFESIPLIDRLSSENWKCKLHGLESLKGILKVELDAVDSSEDILLEYASKLADFTVDNNGNVQRVFLEAFILLVPKLETSFLQKLWTTSKLYISLFEKIMSQPRLLSLCADLLAGILERIGPSFFFPPLMQSLQSYCNADRTVSCKGQQTKRLIGLLSCFESLCHLFGSYILNLPELFKILYCYSTASDSNLKKAVYSLLLEIYAWTMDKDLVTTFLPEKPKAELFRRIQEQAKVDRLIPRRTCWSESGAPSIEKDASQQSNIVDPLVMSISEAQPVDNFDLLCCVDISKQLSYEKLEKRLSSAEKWKEKAEAYKDLTLICDKAKRLQPGDYSGYISLIQKTVQLEGNIAVVVAALRCCVSLAKSLRQQLSPQLRLLGALAFSKLRDRNRSVLSSVVSLLNALLLCGPFDVYIEDIVRVMYDKQPHVRDLGLQYTALVLGHPKQTETVQRCISKLIAFVLDAFDDSTAQVRYRGAQVLKILLDGVHKEYVQAAMQELASSKIQLIQDILARDPPQSSLHNVFFANISNQPEASKTSKTVVVPEPPARVTKTANVGRSENLVELCFDESLVLNQEISLDLQSSQSILEMVIPIETLTHVVEKIHSAAWKDRLEGLDQFHDLLKTVKWTLTTREAEALYVWLRLEGLKNFAETHVNVIKSCLQASIAVVDVFNKHFPKSCIVMLIPYLHDKLGDTKLKPIVVELLCRYASACSPWCVLSCLMASVSLKKATAKVRTEVCLFAQEMLIQYGIPPGDLHYLVDYAKVVSRDRLSAARSASLDLLAMLYTVHPSQVCKMVEKSSEFSDLPEMIMRTALTLPKNKCLDRVTHVEMQATVPKPCAEKSESLEKSVKKPVKQTQEGLKGYLNGSGLNNLLDPKWVSRKDFVLQLQKAVLNDVDSGILSSHSGLHEMFTTLRNRLHDEPNRAVTRELLVLIQLLGSGLSCQAVKTYARCILSAVFQKFSDKNVTIRDTCIKTASIWLKSAGVLQWISCLNASQLLLGSGEEKEPILKILASLDASCYEDLQTSTPESLASLQLFIVCLMPLCCDRHKILRRHAETCLFKLANGVPPVIIQKAYKQLSGANQINIKSVFLKCTELAVLKQSSHIKKLDVDTAEASQTSDMKHTKTHEEVNKCVSTSDDFLLKLTALGLPCLASKLEQYRKTKWSSVVGTEEVVLLGSVWKLLANEKLVSAMLDRSQPLASALSAFSFWEKLFSDPQTFHLFVTSHQINNKNYPTDLIVRWLVVRIWDSNSKIAMAGCSCFTAFLEALAPYGKQHDEIFVLVSSILLSSVIPNLFERLLLTMKSALQLKEKLLIIIHRCVVWCHPQSTYNLLMRLTGSLNKKVLPYALEELALLCFCHSSGISLNPKKDVLKLSGFLQNGVDSLIKNTTLRVLRTFSLLIGEESVISCLKQSCSGEIVEKVRTFFKKNSVSSFSTERLPTQQFNTEEQADCVTLKLKSNASGNQKTSSTSSCTKNISFQTLTTEASDLTQPEHYIGQLGLRDFIKDWVTYIDQHHIEQTFSQTRQVFSNYFYQYKKREKESLQQDLAEDCRRVMEGRLQPNASHISYWNGVMRLEDTKYSLHGECLIVSDLLRSMNRPDPVSISQNAKSLYEFLDGKQSLNYQGNKSPRDWQVVFASEIISVLIFTFDFCFDAKKFRESNEDNHALWLAGFHITQLANRILRDKNVLQRISLFQLHELYRSLIVAMSSHIYWAIYDHGPEIARRLNTIIARDLMTVVIPRNACHLFLTIFYFLLYCHDSLNPSLVLRVHRKIVTKLNSKHNSLPPAVDEVPYYFRALDAAILVLKQLDSCPVFSSITSLTELSSVSTNQSTQDTTAFNLSKLKGQIEILVKEIIFTNLIILGPSLAGVYFRDSGFVGGSVNTLDTPNYSSLPTTLTSRLNYQMSWRLETLMNTPYDRELTGTVCPAILSQSLNEENNNSEISYTTCTNDLLKFGSQKILKAPPLRYPPFFLPFFLSTAPNNTRLGEIDFNLALGWSFRRDVKAGSDIKSLHELRTDWNSTLNEISQDIGLPLNKELALENAMSSLSSNLVHHELVGKYVRRALVYVPQANHVSHDETAATPYPVKTDLA